MHNKLIIANWKENPATEREALKLFAETAKAKRGRRIEVVVCPPVVYLEAVVKKMRGLNLKKGIAIGAQDVFWEEAGSFTSEVGPRMLASLGVTHVIIGHSERRRLMHETDAMVNKKIRAALAGRLNVILCVGEPWAVRKKGITAAKKFIKNQLTKDLKGFRIQDSGFRTKDLKKLHPASGIQHPESSLLVAYEPIWAIGTGQSDTPADASAMATFIKKTLLAIGYWPSASVLYGGSVTGENVWNYVHSKDIDGALVGGASLKGKEIKKMIEGVGKR